MASIEERWHALTEWYSRKGPHRLQCQACACAFWTRYPKQTTCSRKCSARYRVKLKGLGGLQPGSAPKLPPLPMPRESSASVERLLAAAKARRLREERRTGQRRYTITDGWQMKSSHYGNPGADLQGDGWS